MAYVHGLVDVHRYFSCSNRLCFSHQKEVYDPLTRETKVNASSIKGVNETCFKFCVKCIYSQWVRRNSTNIALVLDYCEFLLNEFEDSVEVMRHL